MSTVIAFPGTRPVAPRLRPDDRGDGTRAQRREADIVILPVVRIERHEARLPGPVMPLGNGRRAH
ncbi:hypothetical protein V5F49_00855 [Xanthobacter sp. V3C-3]|uniref:hypothetical protein n=1 Tax=Xanthobacter lutulentifluminis TaxID=3119935 RepID=UPI0037263FD8